MATVVVVMVVAVAVVGNTVGMPMVPDDTATVDDTVPASLDSEPSKPTLLSISIAESRAFIADFICF